MSRKLLGLSNLGKPLLRFCVHWLILNTTWMKLINHLVINFLIVVANEFYVISVSVSISCQVNKKLSLFPLCSFDSFVFVNWIIKLPRASSLLIFQISLFFLMNYCCWYKLKILGLQFSSQYPNNFFWFRHLSFVTFVSYSVNFYPKQGLGWGPCKWGALRLKLLNFTVNSPLGNTSSYSRSCLLCKCNIRHS